MGKQWPPIPHLVVVRRFSTFEKAEAAVAAMVWAMPGTNPQIVNLGPGRSQWAVAMDSEAVDAAFAALGKEGK